jgi:uncharacterized protein with predicted RNA binding PUA domain
MQVENSRKKIEKVIEYIFDKEVSKSLPRELEFTYSKRTGKLKEVRYDNKLLMTIRADGGLALTYYGAKLLLRSKNFESFCVVVDKVAEPFISKGRSVFCKHLVKVGDKIKPNSEVAILNEDKELIAVGKALLSAKMMREFKVGVAIKVREGKPNDV